MICLQRFQSGYVANAHLVVSLFEEGINQVINATKLEISSLPTVLG